MKELDISTISKRALKGFLSLTFRKIALQAISYITINLILARILPVETLGIFNIAAAVITFFAFFSDIGLAAAIIQKKEQVSEEELKTTFTIQQSLVIIIFIIIILAAPFLAQLYHLNESGIWLIRALALSFLITSFKVIPSVLLERELKFNPLVTVEILETLIFNIGLIFLVQNNLGLAAFSYAAIARSISGAVAIYLIAPWRVGFSFSKQSAKVLLGFGVPFQINSILALLKDRLVPLVVAGVVGPVGIGYITWAQNMAFLPLEVMNIIIRVSFPAFSRLQSDKYALKEALEKSLFLTTLFLYPALFGMLALMPVVIEHVVSQKWTPALPSFYLFSLATFWATLSTTFTNTLNAIGHIKTTLKLMVFWTALTWILTIPLTINFGFIGVAISSAIISFTSIVTVVLVKKFVEVEILKSIWQPLLSSVIMSVIVQSIANIFVTDLTSLVLMVILGGVIYLLLILILAKDKISILKGEFKSAFSKD